MLMRWHTLILLTLLLLSSLSVRAQCVFSSPPVGCSSVECLSVDQSYAFSNPFFLVACSNDKEYLKLEITLSQSQYDFCFQNRQTPGFCSILLYSMDSFGDYVQVGQPSVNNLSNSFSLYGASYYQFTFSSISVFSTLKLITSQLPSCSYNFGEKILKANDSSSAMYQCGLFTEAINNPPYSGLGGCALHRCQYYSDKNLVAFCDSKYSDADCYLKADNVWMIGTEYDLSSLPKVMIYLTMLIIYFLGYIAGFLVLSGA